MREFRNPPYRFGFAGIAAAVAVDHPSWNQAEGMCQACADIYRLKLQERKHVAEDILEAIKGLPDLEKRIFVFYHYRGLAIQDIAAREQLDDQCIREIRQFCFGIIVQRIPHSRDAFENNSGLFQ